MGGLGLPETSHPLMLPIVFCWFVGFVGFVLLLIVFMSVIIVKTKVYWLCHCCTVLVKLFLLDKAVRYFVLFLDKIIVFKRRIRFIQAFFCYINFFFFWKNHFVLSSPTSV